MVDLVSVIVPIFNADKYLTQCLESIINQNYKKLEIILIDDGSKDNSLYICQQFADWDNRIKVVKKLNGGVSSARNAGLEVATGEFVYFVDADDYLFPETIELLVSLIANHDLVMCTMKKFCNNEKVKFSYTSNTAIFDTDKALQNILIDKQSAGFLFNKLFRWSIIKEKNLRFNTQLHNCEDELFVMDYLSNDSKIVFNDSVIYAYRDTPNSALNSGINEKSASAIYSRKLIYIRTKELTSNAVIIRNEYDKFIRALVNVYHGTLNGKLCKRWKKEIRSIEREYRGEYPLNFRHKKTYLGYILLRFGV